MPNDPPPLTLFGIPVLIRDWMPRNTVTVYQDGEIVGCITNIVLEEEKSMETDPILAARADSDSPLAENWEESFVEALVHLHQTPSGIDYYECEADREDNRVEMTPNSMEIWEIRPSHPLRDQLAAAQARIHLLESQLAACGWAAAGTVSHLRPSDPAWTLIYDQIAKLRTQWEAAGCLGK